MSQKLTRSRDERWVAGICGGLEDYTGVDVTLIRVVLIISTILGAGSLIVIYLIAWVLIPREPRLGAAANRDGLEPPLTSSR